MPGRASFHYDVFLSFRGEDTRLGFAGNLHSFLYQRGIHCFFDDKEIRKGNKITPQLINAIEQSKIAIVVFSKNYAFSTFCLKELTKILDCYEEKKNNGRVFLPVFYGVDPSDLRYCRGSFGEAMAKHEKSERFKDNKKLLDKWRTSLHKAAEISGCSIKLGNGYEYQLIASISKEVSVKINRTLLHVANYPVGLESRLGKVKSLLKVPSEDVVHMIGIHGIGGIGKSTVARSVYNSVSDQFDGYCCFLEDVRENSLKNGLLNLQEMVLTEILGDKEIRLRNVRNGKSIIQQRLSSKKILLVLDDVDKIEQLQAIAGAPNWFGSGSIVIITTREKNLLLQHWNESKLYEVEELNDQEACELLSWNAFKTDKVDPKYTKILNRALRYASRLPLALEVVGSNLFGKGKEECKLILDRYDRIPDKKIQDILRVSFDSLDEEDKDVFLDIACCFGGYTLSDVENILHAHHGSSMKLSIELLIERSLIKIDDGLVTLHELIQDMGKEIVRQESKEPNERSRLWNIEHVVQVLEENKGTSKIHMLILDFPKDGHVKGTKGEEINWDGEALKEMKNLKTLIIRNGHFSQGPTHLPNSLRVLKWRGYDLSSLPSNFRPKKLCILELPDSCLKLNKPIQAFAYLRILDFSYSEYITEIPDVSGLRDLEKLSFKHCENLTKIHVSVGYLGSLKILDASSCKNLNTFPPIILTSLEQLNLSHCSNLESFPEILGKMENLTELHITGSPIKELPFSIENLTRLRKLELQICGLIQLPSCVVLLPELSLIHVSKCEGLWLSKKNKGKKMVSRSSNMDRLILTHCNISNDFLPKGLNFFSNVKDLNLSGNNFTTVHAWIKECHFLRNLKLDNCSHLQEIRGVPKKLETFSVKGCTSLKCLDLTVLPACTAESSSLKELIVDDCVYLQNITGLPQNLDMFSAKSCTALNSQSISMLLNQEGIQAGNKMFVFPTKKIPEWFRSRTSVKKVHRSRVVRKQEIVGSFSFWFRNKFPAISLCLVIGLGNEQPITVKFSLRVFINGNKQGIGCQKVYEFVIATDHVFLLMLEDNGDMVFSDNQWNHVEVSYADHITNGEVPIRQGARYSGIHVFEQTTDPGDFQFTNPPQTMINANLNPNSVKGAHQRVKRPKKEQTKVLPSPILSLSQLRPPIAEAKKGPGPKPILPDKRSLEDFTGETSERFLEEDVHPTTIPKDLSVIQSNLEGDDDIEHEAVSSSELESEDSYSKTESEGLPKDLPVIQSSLEGDDDIEHEAVSSSELESEDSYSKAEPDGSDSDDPFECVDIRLGISVKETVSSASSSGDSSLGPIREAINSLEMLMVKDLSEVSSDPDTQSGLHQLLNLLCKSSHPKVTVEVKEAIHDFKRKAFLSFQEFKSTVESVNKLKDFEKRLERIQQETVAGKGQRKDLKNSIKKVYSAIKTENSRKKDLEAEIATLRIQLSSKERGHEQLVVNLKNQEESLSTYSTSYASLKEQAQALLKQADDLLAASNGVKLEGKAAEAKQITLKSTWSIDLTNQFNKIKNNIIHLL